MLLLLPKHKLILFLIVIMLRLVVNAKHHINFLNSVPASSCLLPFLQAIRERSFSSNIMRAVRQDEFGGPEKLYMGEADIPQPSENQILIKVFGTAVNRADCLTCKGFYPGQRKDSKIDVLGLEVSGNVHGIGSTSTKWSIGDRVMALVPKGGYSEYVAVSENHVMRVLDGLSLSDAGGIPEVWLTAYQLLHFVGSVKENDFVLIHGGGSGVGTAAVQLAKLAGAVPLVTAGTKDKIDTCIRLGAKKGFNYKEGEFAPGVLEATGGVNLILDCVGGSFWKQNVACLATDGTWVNYGLLGGADVNGGLLRSLLSKRASLLTTTLKSRSDEYKARLIAQFSKNALPYFTKPAIVHGEEIRLKPVVDREFALESVSDAHQHVLDNKNIGKVLLKVQDENIK